MPARPQPTLTTVDSLVREIAHTPSLPVHDLVGQTFGRYRISKLIGKGGMGRVYEAEDLELGRRVAIKFLPASFVEHPDRFARFLRERVVTADLEHPAIIPLYDSGVWPTREPFYVMRQVHGEPLDRRLAAAVTREDRMLLLGNVVAAADAVAFAHSRGVIHRDLKPANVLVGSFGETFVADWGLAKRLREEEPAEAPGGDTEDPAGTHAGSVLGTPAYMAPEQRAGASVDERTDVYALGAILYEMLVGAPLPEGAHEARSTLAERDGSSDLAAIVHKAVAPNPDDRYPSAGELVRELHRLQAGQLIAARRYTRLEILARWLSRHRALVAISVVMTLILAIVVLFSVVRVVRERDLARTERAAANAASLRVTERDEALVLSQARAELTHDPTASLAWLKKYPAAAPGGALAERIAADAVSRGVSSRVWQLGTPPGSVAFSPDSKTLAVGSVDGTLVLLDVEAGGRRALRAPDSVGAHVVFSPAGSLVATSDGVDAVRVWDLTTGTSRRLPGQLVGGHHMAFSPDGSRLVVRHPGGFDHMWEIPSGDPIELPQKDALIVFVGDGRAVVSHGAELDEIDLASGHTLASQHLDGVPYDLQASTKGPWVAASRYDALVVWNTSDGTVRRIPVGKVVARIVSPSPDGRAFMTCGILEEAWVFDATRGAAHVFSTEERCTREGFSFSPDGARFVSTGFGAELRLHEGSTVRHLLGEDESISDAVFSPDGQWLASVGADGAARLWPLSRDEARVDFDMTPLSSVATGQHWLLGKPDGSVSRVGVPGSESVTLAGPRPERQRWAALSANGAVAVVTDAEGALVVWDLTARASRKLGHYFAQDARGPGITNVLSQDGSILAQADERGLVHLIDLATGAERSVGPLDDKAFGVVLSKNAHLLVACTRAGEVHVWDLSSGTERSLVRVQAILWGVAISGDDKRIAAASNDGIVYVIDVSSGEVTRLVGHVGTVNTVDFLPDGRLLSAGTDGTVRVWEGGEGVIVRREPASVGLVTASVDGSLILSSTGAVTSVWRTSSLPPSVADAAAFRSWAMGKTTAEVDEGAGGPHSL